MNLRSVRRLARLAPLALGLALSAGATLATESTASACGGCFVPPEDATVVTDHRMILSVAQGQSTLYDQIRYQGLPQEFAWVLPISGEADVGLSADTLFSTIGGFTQTSIVAPPLNCPSPPSGCGGGDFESASADSRGADAAAGAPGVTVTKVENVGPYATVQLQSENAEALNQWLAENKFTVPADVKPVIAQYVKEHFNFLAMKLRPGANVQAMRPVRVTTKGPAVVLPLRMVAAGTGPVVGITLWVIGDGRYETTNFPSFTIKADELLWDWTKSESNYKALREERTAANKGRGWELESAFRLPIGQIRTGLTSRFGPPGGTGDYTEVPATPTTPAKTADQVREEDLAVLFNKRNDGDFFVTRMRSDLAHAALTEDLALQAAKDQALVSNIRQVTKELNEPLCPVYVGCEQTGTAPRSEAIRSSTNHCAAAPLAPRAEQGLAAAAVGFVGLAFARVVRRRRKQG
ncbi:MAG: DUF2330 domain-containing protein [Myxococcales bacterium]|jgi:hypothetical protein|nr:DUF2330 domain-containing protein [Myxococcales bacterium]MBL0195290.1 DUF2330 domain-containing protein [Myxococcales bacterium]HQY62885.1 DUF2330 domain-containing protein [Polyangiaceae bacterium]